MDEMDNNFTASTDNNSIAVLSVKTDNVQVILDRIQFTMTLIGFLGNVMCLFTLIKNHQIFSPTGLVYLYLGRYHFLGGAGVYP